MCTFLMALPTPYQMAATLGIEQTKLICSIEVNPTPERPSSGLWDLRLYMLQIKWIPICNGVFCIEGILPVLPVEESLHILQLTLNLESSCLQNQYVACVHSDPVDRIILCCEFLHYVHSTKASVTLYSNIYPTRCNVTQLILSGNCSTCFGWYHHPSSGAQTSISTASGICHIVNVICRYCLLHKCIRQPQHTQTSSNYSTIAADSINGVTNVRSCRYNCLCSWWWVEVPLETCRAVSR